MFPKAAEKKLRELLEKLHTINTEIDRESQNRPVRDIIRIGEQYGWTEQKNRGKGSHRQLIYPNWNEFITLKCHGEGDEIWKDDVRRNLDKIYKPHKIDLIKDILGDSQVRDMLRVLLAYSHENIEDEIYRLARQCHNLTQELEEYKQILVTLDEPENFNVVANNKDLEYITAQKSLLDEAQKELDRKIEEIKNYATRVKQLEIKNQELQKSITILKENIQQLEADKNPLEERLYKLERQLSQSEAQHHNQVKVLNQERQNLVQRHKSIQSQSAEQLTILTSKVKQLELENQELQNSISSLKKNIRHLAAAKNSLEERLYELKRQLSQSEAQSHNQVEVLNQERQNLIQRHQIIQSHSAEKLTILTSKVKQLEFENQQLQTRVTELQYNSRQNALNQSQVVLTNRLKSYQKSLWISSLIAAGIVVFNPNPNWLNALAVFSIPSATLVFSSRKPKNIR